MRDLSEDEQRWAGVLGILARQWESRARMDYADVERQHLGTIGPYNLVQSAFNTIVNELLRAKLIESTVGPGEWEIQQLWLTDAGREWLAARGE